MTYKNALVKSFHEEDKVVASVKEIFMMVYLWSCCLKSKRFNDIKEWQAKVTKSLDMKELFTSIDFVDQLEEEAARPKPLREEKEAMVVEQ